MKYSMSKPNNYAGILGNKLGMTQIFNKNGEAIPVTVIRVGPCLITTLKNESIHGYTAVQVGFSKVTDHKTNRPNLGHLKKLGLPTLEHLKEFRTIESNNFLPGQIIDVENFKVGQYVSISGKTIGKGFAGNQKRNNFRRGPMAHGSKNHRAPGSIGAGTTPGRVFPGKKMAGQLGNSNVTIKRLQIIGIDSQRNIIVLKGSVPGKSGNYVALTLAD